MREIKFRAWDKNRKEYRNDIYLGSEGKLYQFSKNTGYGTAIVYANDEVLEIMQYTGLKDKNDKEIYEGDIIKYHNGVDIRINKVSYVNGCFVVCSVETPNRNLYLLETYHSFVEVIGNIYENPELLEVEK